MAEHNRFIDFFTLRVYKTSERQRALLRTGWLAMTIPDKPRHITTETGKEALKTEKLFWMRE